MFGILVFRTIGLPVYVPAGKAVDDVKVFELTEASVISVVPAVSTIADVNGISPYSIRP
jgi:hypothetical protein